MMFEMIVVYDIVVSAWLKIDVEMALSTRLTNKSQVLAVERKGDRTSPCNTLDILSDAGDSPSSSVKF